MVEMKSEVLYLKLGEKASSFVDSQNKIVLSNNQIIKVNKSELSSGVLARITSGHLEKATKEEYENFMGSHLQNGGHTNIKGGDNNQSGEDNTLGYEEDSGNPEFYADKTKSDMIDLLEELSENNKNLEGINFKKYSLQDLIKLHKKYSLK